MTTVSTVNIGKDFNRFPSGRYKAQGPASGEQFREEFLVPMLKREDQLVEVQLDDAIGYGSSFLEEAFGGLVRHHSFGDLENRIVLISDDLSLVAEIKSYIGEAKKKKRKG